MKFNFRTLAAFVAMSAMMTGCAKDDTSSSGTSSPLLNTSNKSQTNEIDSISEVKIPVNSDTPDAAGCTIKFEDGKITAEGSGATISNNTVKISKSGVYELSGSSSDCKIEIAADKDSTITLILNNVSLTSKSGSVIDCEKAEMLSLYSNDGTKNFLSDSENYGTLTETDPDAAVFTRSDLIINGRGELNIVGLYGDAVKCKDALTIFDGKTNITSADDGITGKDSVNICGGIVKITSLGDGIKSTNDTDAGKGDINITGGELVINSEKDGISAKKDLNILDGKITVTAGGEAADNEITKKNEPWDFDKRGDRNKNGSDLLSNNGSDDTDSLKGIKADGDITINGGAIEIKSADDSIHSNANIEILGGTLTLSSCDDAIHADELLVIRDGEISITKSYEGLEGKCIEIGGGKIDIKSTDDGINAAGGDNGSFFGYGNASDEYYISISGGEITVHAEGDGIDSNGTIAQSGGFLTIFGPTDSGNGAIDYERSYAMSGGTLIALGSIGMAQTPSTLSQPCLSINAQAAAGDVIEVRSGNDVILSVETPKDAQSLIFSSDKFKSGTDYDIYISDTLSVTVTANEGVSGNGGMGMGGMRPGGNHGPGGFGGAPGGRF